MPGRRIRRLLRSARILVDAHNVCYADAHLRRLMLEDPERARHALEARIGERSRVLCFFDGGPGGRSGPRWRQGRTGHDSGAGCEADDQLIRWLQDHQEESCCVVTRDRHLGERARALGARLVDNDAFLEWLAPEQPPVHEDHSAAEGDVDFWLTTFGVDGDMDIEDFVDDQNDR